MHANGNIGVQFLGNIMKKKKIDFSNLELRDGLFYEKGADEPFSGEVYTRKIKNGLKEGLWIEDEDFETSYFNFSKGKKHGPYREYDNETGNLISHGFYNNDKLEDVRVEYYDNGILKSLIFHKNGKEEDILTSLKSDSMWGPASITSKKVKRDKLFQDNMAHSIRYFQSLGGEQKSYKKQIRKLENQIEEMERKNISLFPLILFIIVVCTFFYWFKREDFVVGAIAGIVAFPVCFFVGKFALEYATESASKIDNHNTRTIVFSWYILFSLFFIDLIFFLGTFFVSPLFTFLQTGSIECTFWHYTEGCN